MHLLEKMVIPSKEIEEEDWENQSMSGWMIFFSVSLIFLTIFGVAAAFQRQFVPIWAKWLEAAIYVLPLYSALALMLRFRDAIFCTLMALTMIIAIYASSVFRFYFSNTPLNVCYPSVIILALAVIATFYFLNSKKVKIRFPSHERKVFWFDLIPIAISIIIAFLVILNSFFNTLNNKEWNYSRLNQLDEILAKGVSFAEFQSSFQLTSASTQRDRVILFFKINPFGVRPFSPEESMREIETDEYTRYEIKKVFVENNRQLMDCFLDMKMGLVMFFFINNINDGTEIFLNNNEIKGFLDDMNISIKKEEDDFKEISLYADSLNNCCPIAINSHISLESVACNEVKLNFRFSLNESKASFADYEPVFKEYIYTLFNDLENKDKKAAPLSLSPEILKLMKGLEMDLSYTLTASKSRFSKDYTEWRLYFSKSPQGIHSSGNADYPEKTMNPRQRERIEEKASDKYFKV